MRGVVDGFASAAEIAEMLLISPPEPQPPQHSAINTWRWETPSHLPLFASLVARAQLVRMSKTSLIGTWPACADQMADRPGSLRRDQR